jgi:hypothetical protein
MLPGVHPNRRKLARGAAVIARVAVQSIYMLDLMATTARMRHVLAMSLPVACSPTRRDADNELYERGCDLVEAAAAIHRVAESPRAAPAIPAFLGCVEAALHELSCTAVAMQQTSGSLQASADPRMHAVTDRMHRGFANLNAALADAEAASRAARPLAARTVVAAAGLRKSAAR